MRKLIVVPLEEQFIIKAEKSGFILAKDGDFTPFNSEALGPCYPQRFFVFNRNYWHD